MSSSIRMKKILIVAESVNINDSSGSKANVALISNLKRAGFEVCVYHYTRMNIALPDIECHAIKERKFNLMYVLSRSQRLFTRWTKINLNPLLESWFGFSFTFFNDAKSIAAGLKKVNFQPDLVLTLSKGASFRPHYALLQLPDYHDKWMAYVHDPYPFHYYPRPYNWVQPGYKQKERFFRAVSERAKYSGFPSLLLKEWMGSYFPDFLKTGVVLPHQMQPLEGLETTLPEYFNPNKFTILHAGNLMKQRSPEVLLKAYADFLSKNPDAVSNSNLLLVGPADYFTKELEQYEKEMPGLIVKNRNIPFAEVIQMQFEASVNVILESISEISPFLPGKFPHCVAANKPILLLAPYYSETRRLLGNDYPFWAETTDADCITAHLEKMYSAWKLKADLSLNRKDLEEYLNSDYLKKEILSI